MTITLFRDIIRQSWQIMLRFKYLWLFGFFAALLGAGGELQVLISNVLFVGDSPETLIGIQGIFSTGLLGVLFTNFKDFLTGSTLEAILFLLVFIVGAVMAIWLIITSQGALYDGVSRILKGKKVNIAQGYKAGATYFGRILSLNVISAVVIYGLLTIISLPIILVLLLKSTETGILLFVLFSFLILILFALPIIFIVKYAMLYAVVHDHSLWQSLSAGWNLFKKNVLATLEMAILIFVLSIASGLALLIVLAFLSVPFILLGMLAIIFNTPFALSIVIVLGFIVIGIAIIMYGALFSTFRYSAWTLFFHRLIADKGSSKILRVFGQAADYFGKNPSK